MVRASELSTRAILDAMQRGDFYATTGVILDSYEAGPKAIRIRLSQGTLDLGWSLPNANPQLYRTEFIGKDGKVLKVDESSSPSYELMPGDLYVRARITNSDGAVAWTQPVFRK